MWSFWIKEDIGPLWLNLCQSKLEDSGHQGSRRKQSQDEKTQHLPPVAYICQLCPCLEGSMISQNSTNSWDPCAQSHEQKGWVNRKETVLALATVGLHTLSVWSGPHTIQALDDLRPLTNMLSQLTTICPVAGDSKQIRQRLWLLGSTWVCFIDTELSIRVSLWNKQRCVECKGDASPWTW